MLRGLLWGGLLAFRRNIPTYRVVLRCSIPTGRRSLFRRNIPTYRVTLRCSIPTAG